MKAEVKMKLLVMVFLIAALSLDMAFSGKWRPKSRASKDTCLRGDGSSYRGDVAWSAYSRRCLNWNRYAHMYAYSLGLGNHNYCRNPDHSLMPWCRVRRGRRIVREFCDIPRCPRESEEVPHVEDTELTCGETSERRANKIVGGSFTPIESHPWLAAIFLRREGFLCGGSLISPCWVATAAHCFIAGNSTDVRDLTVYVGKTAINETDPEREQRFTVDRLILHPNFDDDTFNNDIALLRIRGMQGRCAAKSASSRVVCLPPLHTHLPDGFQCSIAGFGYEGEVPRRYSQHLKQADVNLISQTVCKTRAYYENQITENMLCAGSPDWSTDACKGDSGGPLVCEVNGRMFLFGVVSWGEGCALRNKPGVYTQVANYNKWIAAKTGLSTYTRGLMYPTK